MQDLNQNLPGAGGLPPMPPKEGEMARPASPAGRPTKPLTPLDKRSFSAPQPVKKSSWEPVDVSHNKLFRNKELLGKRESVVRGIRDDLTGTLSKFSDKNAVAKGLAKAGAKGYLTKGKIRGVLEEELKAGHISRSQARRVRKKYGAF